MKLDYNVLFNVISCFYFFKGILKTIPPDIEWIS